MLSGTGRHIHTQTVSHKFSETPFCCCVCDCLRPSAVIQKLRCYCQLSCKPAPASNKLANPPYAIHNFGWKEGLSNNDDDRVKARDGNLRSPLDLKSISVTASECRRSGAVFTTASSAVLSLTWSAQHSSSCMSGKHHANSAKTSSAVLLSAKPFALCEAVLVLRTSVPLVPCCAVLQPTLMVPWSTMPTTCMAHPWPATSTTPTGTCRARGSSCSQGGASALTAVCDAACSASTSTATSAAPQHASPVNS